MGQICNSHFWQKAIRHDLWKMIDAWQLDKLFTDYPCIINPDLTPRNQIGDYVLVGESAANTTPWNCPRDIP